MKRRLSITLVLLCLSALCARAQFMTYGTEPSSVKWSVVETDNYRVIYPRGLDSLAMVYARNIEECRMAVAGSIGMAPNEFYRRKFPVILHSLSTISNGMVTWTPRRMELYTCPDSFSPEAVPWETHLAIHESRHIAQMQAGKAPKYGVFNALVGELFSGAMAGIYSGPAILEGDAVVAETALTRSGRGRNYDFMAYYRASLAGGGKRDYWQWRWGSLKRYTPDHYKLGYLMEAGLDCLWDSPGFARSYYSNIRERFFPLFNFQKTVKGISGKNVRDTFTEISDSLAAFWAADAAARAPYTPLEQHTPSPRRFTSFYGSASLRGNLYSVRSSLVKPGELVRITSDGTATRIAAFGTGTSRLRADEAFGRLYWSEIIGDPRWEMSSSSDIRFFDGEKLRFLTRGGRYFHPAPSPEGRVAATCYPVEGGSRTVVLDLEGNVTESYSAPGHIQILENAWLDGELYCSGVSEEGMGIYRVRDFSPVLPPSFTHIKQLDSHGGRLFFISDRDGAGELYSLSPEEGTLRQMTSTPDGISEWVFQGEQLLVTKTDPDGKMLHRANIGEGKGADFRETAEFPFARTLSSREMPAPAGEPVLSEARNYSKLGHLIHFHSWAPVYVNIDDFTSMSFSSMSQNLGLGATGFFQNELGSMSGFVAYSGWTAEKGFRSSAHAGFTYTGLYPVIETQLDFNERTATDFTIDNSGITPVESSRPYFYMRTQAYIPWKWNYGGWNRGLSPRLDLVFNNDAFPEEGVGMRFRMGLSARAYIMRTVAQSEVYPRWGAGMELGYRSYPGTGNLFCDTFYGYAYGYLPGLAPTHGIRLTALAETALKSGKLSDSRFSASPRGFAAAALSRMLATYPLRGRWTADYVLPFAPVDWSFLCPVAYIKGFELTLHYDHCFATGGKRPGGSLESAGADFNVRLANLAWIPYDTRIGVSYSYNFGSLFEYMKGLSLADRKHYIGMIFSISL